MKLNSKNSRTISEKALISCLQKVPFLRITSIREGPISDTIQADFWVKISLPWGGQDLVIEVRNNGQPRPAREAVNQLLRHQIAYPDVYGVFMAPYISAAAAEICQKENVGYIDLSGNCRLCFGQIYIEKEGKPNLFAQKRNLRSLYSPKAERVLRVLLLAPGKKWKLKDLAREAGVSLGQASNLKKLLSDREWIHTGPDGLSLREPEQLLSEWAENYNYQKNTVRSFYSLKKVAEIEANLARICRQRNINYALTGFSAAARLAPAVKYQRAMAYIEKPEQDLTSLLELKEVPSGANLILFIPYDEGVFYGNQDIDGIRITSPIQTYLDLLGFRDRGEEAANVLLENIIQPKW